MSRKNIKKNIYEKTNIKQEGKMWKGWKEMGQEIIAEKGNKQRE